MWIYHPKSLKMDLVHIGYTKCAHYFTPFLTNDLFWKLFFLITVYMFTNLLTTISTFVLSEPVFTNVFVLTRINLILAMYNWSGNTWQPIYIKVPTQIHRRLICHHHHGHHDLLRLKMKYSQIINFISTINLILYWIQLWCTVVHV